MKIIAFDSAFGWIKHAGGISKLIEMRGIHRLESPPERILFWSNRITIILDCLVRRKRCFMEREEWKAIPWTAGIEPRRLNFLVQNIFCDVPGLMEDESTLKELSNHKVEGSKRELLIKVMTYFQQLYFWRSDWETTYPASCSELNIGGKKPFQVVLYYSTLDRANEIILYDSILLLLWRLGRAIVGQSFRPPKPERILRTNQYLLLPGELTSQQAVATEICRSVDFLLLEEHRITGAYFLLFPLKLVMQEYAEGGEEAAWLAWKMQQIADLTGFEISRSLAVKEPLVLKS